jgi:hypothetical protein|nr:MAG TPA: hypothetical protein [Caudoviricetes sp.]
MDNAYIQVLADGTGIVVSCDFDMGIGVIAGPRILARLTKEQINMIRETH